MNEMRPSGFLLAKIHQLAGRIFARKLRDFGIEINPPQGRIMFVLWQEDEIPIIELARQTSLEKSTLTSMLDRLEEAGYIMRVPSKEDRRKILIKRTEKDKAFQNLYLKVSQDMLQLTFKGFSEKEITQFEDYLKRVFDNLAEYDASK